MRLHLKVAIATAALAVGLTSALAGVAYGSSEYQPPNQPPHEQGTHGHEPRGHAYGYYCKGESKKHVKGQKGTPFSECVKAAARAAHQEQLTARQACKCLSKKHVKGQKGTPFSVCVKGVAKMKKEEAQTQEGA